MGEIMRGMDDSLVFYLLQRYDGFDISPEGVLAMIHSHIHLSELDPHGSHHHTTPIGSSASLGDIGAESDIFLTVEHLT
jgi:hypothetical protein